MPPLKDNFGEVDGRQISVFHTCAESPEGHFLAYLTRSTSAWGDTIEDAVTRLKDRVTIGYTVGDPKALLAGGFDAESKRSSER